MLTEKQKEKIRRMWIDEVPSGDIANKLGLTRSTVMGYVHRCKQKGILQARGGVSNAGGNKAGTRHAKDPPIKRKAPYVRPKPAPWLAPLFEANRPGVTLMQLKDHHCRFITSEIKGADTRYCGEPKVAKSMCAEHHALCYTPPPSRAEARRNKVAFRYGRMTENNSATRH